MRKTDGVVNIALGPVLELWHEYRDAGIETPEEAQLPPMDALVEAAAQHTDISKIQIDEENSTVYIEDGNTHRRGCARQRIRRRRRRHSCCKKRGFDSVLISAGGNVKAIGGPERRMCATNGAWVSKTQRAILPIRPASRTLSTRRM